MITQPANLPSFLQELRTAKIDYRLSQHRDEAIMVKIAVPGERWEVEFLDDGSVEAEVFKSDGTIHDGSVIGELITKHSS
jgi:hypothetical protein